jgi:hypothetical protein
MPPRYSRLLPGERPRLPAQEVELVAELDKILVEQKNTQSTMYLGTMYIPNLDESHRDLEHEGSFFVHHDPHLIRPPADTGVLCKFDGADKQIKVSLKYPPQIPEYEWNSIQLRTAHKICPACLDVFNYYGRYIEAQTNVRGLVKAPIWLKADFEIS